MIKFAYVLLAILPTLAWAKNLPPYALNQVDSLTEQLLAGLPEDQRSLVRDSIYSNLLARARDTPRIAAGSFDPIRGASLHQITYRLAQESADAIDGALEAGRAQPAVAMRLVGEAIEKIEEAELYIGMARAHSLFHGIGLHSHRYLYPVAVRNFFDRPASVFSRATFWPRVARRIITHSHFGATQEFAQRWLGVDQVGNWDSRRQVLSYGPDALSKLLQALSEELQMPVADLVIATHPSCAAYFAKN